MPTTMKGVLRECKVTTADVEEGREEGGGREGGGERRGERESGNYLIKVLPPCFISRDLWPPPYWNVIFLRDLSNGP